MTAPHDIARALAFALGLTDDRMTEIDGLAAEGVLSGGQASEHDAETLEAVKSLPVSFWNYKNDDVRHIGPMAETFQEATGLGDGMTIDFIDAFGVLLAAVRGLASQVEELQHAAA